MALGNKTGWERERRVHFDEIVLNYDKVRPEYPVALFEEIMKYSGPGEGTKALEIGAGTGKATIPFLNAGYSVTAVELGAKMADFMVERFHGNDRFKVITGTFEDALVEEDRYDLVYAASAFHWVDAETGCPKIYRILKSRGAIALFRYNLVPAVGEELYEEIQESYEKFYYSYYKSSQRLTKISKDQYWEPWKIHQGFGFESLEKYGFMDISKSLYDVTRTFDADEYIALLDTMSDHRSLPEYERAALYNGIKEAIQRHGGQHRAEYVFQLYMGRKP